jgi:hypothetical protein
MTTPVFPGGMEVAPELTSQHCEHEACLCHVEAGRRFCSLACARLRELDGVCACAHFGCSYHRA